MRYQRARPALSKKPPASMKASLLILLSLLLGLGSKLHAQVKVEIKIAHRLYVAYEPILATVSITNLSGRDLELKDVDGNQWFGFQVLNLEDQPVAPRDLHYKLEPLVLEAGSTVKRTVNLVTLFPVTEFGLYRVKATIFFAPLNRYYTSVAQNIEVTEGKTIWQQTVGAPGGEKEGDGYRNYNVMTHRLPAETRLYVRVEDREKNLVLATYPIGRLTFGESPEVMLDASNRLHILHPHGPRSHLHTEIGLDGEFIGQTTIVETKTRPRLRKVEGGRVAVFGGALDLPPQANATPPPKLSDRPPGLPKL